MKEFDIDFYLTFFFSLHRLFEVFFGGNKHTMREERIRIVDCTNEDDEGIFIILYKFFLTFNELKNVTSLDFGSFVALLLEILLVLVY